MSGLFKLERVNPITQELVLLDERRDKAINGLIAVINGFGNHFDTEISQSANLLTGSLNLYGVGVTQIHRCQLGCQSQCSLCKIDQRAECVDRSVQRAAKFQTFRTGLRPCTCE